MSDDLADELDQIAADHAKLAARATRLADRLRRLGRGRDALDDLLTTMQAATICGVTDQAIRYWIEHAASIGQPIAVKRVTWVVSKSRLLAYVEEHCGGKHARVKAENLFKEHWPRWSQAPELRTDAKERAAS
jgi:hypothetical protein